MKHTCEGCQLVSDYLNRIRENQDAAGKPVKVETEKPDGPGIMWVKDRDGCLIWPAYGYGNTVLKHLDHQIIIDLLNYKISEDNMCVSCKRNEKTTDKHWISFTCPLTDFTLTYQGSELVGDKDDKSDEEQFITMVDMSPLDENQEIIWDEVGSDTPIRTIQSPPVVGSITKEMAREAVLASSQQLPLTTAELLKGYDVTDWDYTPETKDPFDTLSDMFERKY